MNLLDMLAQLNIEIRDGEAYAAFLRLNGGSKEERDAVDDDLRFLRAERRHIELKGYYQVTGEVVPDLQQPDATRAIRERMKRRSAGEV